MHEAGKRSWSFTVQRSLAESFEFLRPAVQRYKVCSCIHSSEFECLFSKKKHIRYKPRGGASGNAHLFTCLSTLHRRGMFCCFVVLYVCVWYVCGQCVFFTTSAREVLRYRSVKRASFCRNFVVATVVFHKAGPLPYAL